MLRMLDGFSSTGISVLYTMKLRIRKMEDFAQGQMQKAVPYFEGQRSENNRHPAHCSGGLIHMESFLHSLALLKVTGCPLRLERGPEGQS